MIFASSSGDHFDCFLAGDVVGNSAVDAARFKDCGCGRKLGEGLFRSDALLLAGVACWLIFGGTTEKPDEVVREADDSRRRSSSSSPCLASLGLRSSEISTFGG